MLHHRGKTPFDSATTVLCYIGAESVGYLWDLTARINGLLGTIRRRTQRRLIALPLFINVNSFRPEVESEATAALGRQVTVGDLSLSIVSGSVGAENIVIANDPVFSKSPFVTAKSLKIGIELMPLIFSKQLNVTEITLNDPEITRLLNRDLLAASRTVADGSEFTGGKICSARLDLYQCARSTFCSVCEAN